MHLSSNNKTTPQFFSWPPEAGSKGESVAIDCTKVHKTFLSVYIIVCRCVEVDLSNIGAAHHLVLASQPPQVFLPLHSLR